MDPAAPPFPLTFVAHPAEDVPGEWVAHCLEVDVVMQGPTADAALRAAAEGAALVVASDLARGADPLARRAPPECWGRAAPPTR